MRLTRETTFASVLSILAGVLAMGALHWWLTRDVTAHFAPRVPGMDNPHHATKPLTAQTSVTIGEFFRTADGKPSTIETAWPNFRGPDGDNISKAERPLSTHWGPDGPPVLWSLELGEGHAAPAVHGGRVFLLDYDEKEKGDALRCLSLDDGREIWRRWYRVQVKRNHGRSRTIPAVTDPYTVTLGPRCHVMCVDTDTGQLRWTLDMVATYGTRIPGWYAGQCPRIDDGIAVLAPAGTNVLMLGIDCESGTTVWSTPNPDGWPMSHASIAIMMLAGRAMYVYPAIGAIVGVAADGPDRGRILWKNTDWPPAVIAPSPLALSDSRVFLTAGYGGGSIMLQVREKNGEFMVNTLYAHTPKQGPACEQQTPLYYQEHLFGIQPKDAGSLRKQFVCYHPDGTLVWASGKQNRFGLGPFMIADGKFLILDDQGVLTAAEVSLTGYRQLAQAKVLHGHDSWGPLALVEGRLLLRDSKQLVCLDLNPTRTATDTLKEGQGND